MKINLIANFNGTMVGLSFGSEKTITIGSEPGNTIAPLASEGLSRRHAKIYEKDGKWLLEDLGSTNGTYRLGEKIEGITELKSRDMLQFGKIAVSVDDILSDEAPLASAPAQAAAPVAPVTPVAPAAQAAPTAPATPASPVVSPVTPASPATAVLRRPALPGAKGAGLKLPPKPALGAGLKLPPKPTLGAGLKLPPKPVLGGAAAPAKAPEADAVAELTPVE